MMIRRSVLLFLPLMAAFLLLTGPASAQTVKRIADHKDWSAYTTTEGDKLVCFIASVPTKSEGKYTRRGKVFSIVTLRPAENRAPEVSFIAGYTFKDGSAVSVDIDGTDFSLFTKGDTAWLPNDPDLDKAMIRAMVRGVAMVVRGTSSRGTLTTDTYSLRGFTAAYKAIQGACK